MVIAHKCENCGADMVFDAKSGMLMCPSCGTFLDISGMENEIDKEQKNEANNPDINIQEPEGKFEQHEYEYDNPHNKTFSEEESSQVNEFVCKNCGARLITDSRTTSTKCSFCDSPMVIGDRLTGALAPSYIIPFKIGKQDAKTEFDKWRKKAWLAPSGFKKSARLKELAGQYVPFWLYILRSQGELRGTGIVERTFTRGEWVYTEKKYYDVYRRFDLDIRGIPVDASKKMDDEVMDKLEPFEYKDLKEFNTPYLAGYLAEKYDYTDKEMYDRAKKRAMQYSEDFARESVSRYTMVVDKSVGMNIMPQRTDYVLLPIWMFNYNYNDKDYMFTMNAQTGKVVGKPPISKPKTVMVFLFSTVVFTFIMRLLAFLMGGDLI